MKKKMLSALLALSMIGTMGTGICASAESSDPDEITVRFMCFGTVPSDMQMVEDAINEITVPEINVKVNYEAISASSYGTQLALDMTSGGDVDVFYNYDFTNTASNKQLLDLSPYLETYGQDIVEAASAEWLQATTVAGKVYGVPILNGKGASLVVAMRTDILEKYGLTDKLENMSVSEDIKDDTAEATLETISEIYATVLENEPEMIMLCAGGAGTLNLEKMINYDALTDSNGVLMGNDGWEVVNLYETDEFKSVIQTLRDWYLAGYIKSDVSTDTESYTSYASAGRMFSVMLGSDETLGTSLERTSGYPYTAVRIKTPLATSETLNGQTWCVSSTTKHPEAAVKFLNLAYSSAEIENLMCYGIEGVHYAYQEDGTVDYADGVDSTTTGYSMSTYWEMPYPILAASISGNGSDYNANLLQQNKEVKNSRALGFSFDTANVSSELTAISAVGSQYMTGFLTGSLDIDENYDSFIQKLKDAGIEKVIAEKQSQLDAWREANNAE